jgi:translation elongation factor P/translation initiation factor 5A
MPTDVNIGDIILLQNKPCKIIEIFVCKTGKHGGAKYHFIGHDIFTQKRYEELFMSHQQLSAPFVSRVPMRVIYIENDGSIHLQNMTSLEMRDDLYISDHDFCEKLIDLFNNHANTDKELFVIVLSCMGIERIVEHKIVNSK